jgi:hypothetical protein
MSYWACALLEAHRERTAIRFLRMAGYETYCPWLSVKRSIVPLFPRYCFVLIADRRWWAARWSIAVRNIVRSAGDEPACVPDVIISGLRAREKNGLIQLPQKPGLRRDGRCQQVFSARKGHAFRVARQGLSSRRSWLLANRRWTGGRRLSLVKRCDQVVDKGSR